VQGPLMDFVARSLQADLLRATARQQFVALIRRNRKARRPSTICGWRT
jgi:hypothetical protein